MQALVYQGGGRQLNHHWLEQLSEWTLDGIMPDLTFCSTAQCFYIERINKRSTKDRIEVEEVQFFERAREAYLERAALEPNRFIVIDASLPEVEVLNLCYLIF